MFAALRGHGQRRVDLRAMGGIGGDQQQIALEAMAHDERRILGERG